MTLPLESNLCARCRLRPAAPGDRLCPECRAAVEADRRRRYRELAEVSEKLLALLKNTDKETS